MIPFLSITVNGVSRVTINNNFFIKPPYKYSYLELNKLFRLFLTVVDETNVEATVAAVEFLVEFIVVLAFSNNAVICLPYFVFVLA